MSSAPSKKLIEVSRDEVSKHSIENDFWIIIDSKVYDLSRFLRFHPGGKHVLLEFGGSDATRAFYSLHRADVLSKYPNLLIGKIAGEKEITQGTRPGEFSAVPYAEPLGSSPNARYPSPYYNKSHIEFKKALRAFVDKEIVPHAASMEENDKEPPIDLWQKMGQFGLLAARIGPGPWLRELVESKTISQLPGNVQPQQFDYFHELIAHQEVARLGTPGFIDGLGAGYCIGQPCLLNFGTEEMKKVIAPQVFLGNKRICLAISEAFAGSDVANVKTIASKTPDGQYYIVNGTKKWITNGSFADYFVTAVRTGTKGHSGLSMLLIERSEGLATTKIKTSYSGSAGTAFITFDNVKVPVKNLLGNEGDGFKQIMHNFNHERWFIVCQICRASRVIVEDCLNWIHQREIFNKKLSDQPVIRYKMAQSIAALESIESWLEAVTFSMCKMSYKEQSKFLAGPIALLKYHATRTQIIIGDNAAQLFGGRAITRTGMGQNVERFNRSLKYGSILGGSEEIMADLGIRQAMKFMPKTAKL